MTKSVQARVSLEGTKEKNVKGPFRKDVHNRTSLFKNA